jgi:hypothetical protein
MVLEVENAGGLDHLQVQAQKILQSEEFRSSEVLRRLLGFLVQKTVSGEADQLKEYSVAVDGLGKADTYDPQHNSAVRIQMGRLRQRLAEYYRTEGKDDPILIDLPKGRFRLTFEERAVSSQRVEREVETPGVVVEPVPAPAVAPPKTTFSRWYLAAAVVLLALGYGFGHGVATHSLASGRALTPEQETLWRPFIDTRRPLIITIEDPLFAEVRSNPGVYFRDRSINVWSDALNSEAIKKLTGALQQSEIRPSRYYTAFGEAEASFLLGGLLQSHERALSLMRTSQLSWQQLADNNVIFVGVQNLFFDQLRGMPIAPQLVPDLNGVRDEHPADGAPEVYTDQYVTAPNEQGILYALVTHLPGPNGQSEIESFTSNRSAGYLSAVQWFTDANFAKTLEGHLLQVGGGKMPRSYQVLLRVRFRDGVPTGTEYVLGRELK